MAKDIDKRRCEKILKILSQEKDGITISKISKITKIPYSSVYYYLHGYLKHKVKIKSFGLKKRPAIKIYSLRR